MYLNCFSYAALQEHIATETDISARDQLILYKYEEFGQVVSEMAPAHTYPTTTPTQPLFLFHAQSNVPVPKARLPDIRELHLVVTSSF